MYKGKSIHLVTYGVKGYRRPETVDLTVNCLNIPNPYNKPGAAEEVMVLSPGFPVTLGLALENILDKFRHTDHVEAGVCCLYGQHRSPMMAAILTKQLEALGVVVEPTTHLERN